MPASGLYRWISDVIEQQALALDKEIMENHTSKQMTHEEAINLQINLMRHALEILEAKRKDYSGDIDPFGNFRSSVIHGIEPWRGVLIRMEDKFARIRNIVERGGIMNVEEKFIDTFADIFNYTGIFAGLVWEELDLTEMLDKQERVDDG